MSARFSKIYALASVFHELIIFFSNRNPNVPGQKLKVKIPKKADMEKRNFVVSIPAPKVTAELQENSFSQEYKEALQVYSCAYDDWCNAEGKRNLFCIVNDPPTRYAYIALASNCILGKYDTTLPKEKRKNFKLNTEKKNKFDRMVQEFPNNLAVPLEISYLRKIVRQERSKKQRREKRKEGSIDNMTTARDRMVAEQQQQEFEMCVPQKGTHFSSVVFQRLDFVRN